MVRKATPKRRATRATAKKIAPIAPGPIHVSIPAAVANDLKSFQKVQASILDRLGCMACCSGFDIRFDVIRSFSVDEKLNISERLGSDLIINR